MSTTTTYTLQYFGGRGLAELSRSIFHYKKVPFNDQYVDREWLNSNRHSLKFGQVPRLLVEEDGKVVLELVQSKTIARYLARKFNLYGDNEIEAAQIDELLDGISDLRDLITKAWFAGDAKEKMWNELKQEGSRFQFILNVLNKQIADKKFLVGDKLTLADLWLFTTLEEFIENLKLVDTEKFAHLHTYVNNIKQIDGIKEYVASPDRPLSFYG